MRFCICADELRTTRLYVPPVCLSPSLFSSTVRNNPTSREGIILWDPENTVASISS